MELNRHRTILLVEDNRDDRELILFAFNKHRIANQIDIAKDGEEALDYLFARGQYAGKEGHQLPVLIMLDINLPKINGIEVLEKLRNHDKTKLLPVVMFTSSNEEKDLIDSYQLGANSYIRKPVDPDKFEQAIRQLELYWLLINEPPPVNRHF